jgi:hypothetical protein
MVKGLVIAPCSAFVLYLVVSAFIQNAVILYGVPLLVFVILIYSALFGENIRFEVDGGELRYYKRGKLKNSFQLAGCRVGYRRKSETGLLASHDISLQIIQTENGEETFIDCSPIGPRQFERMYALMKSKTPEEPEVLRAGSPE